MSAVVASVIVNNCNYDAYVGEAIDSALEQTYPLTEVIVVDDGSTDRSREVIATYGHRIRSVLKENGGQASAFAAGFAACRGDVVLFLDADDRVLPEAVAEAVRQFGDAGVVNVHWPLSVIDANGSPTGAVMPSSTPAAGDLRRHVIERGPDSYLGVPCSGNAWSRGFLEQVLPAEDEAAYVRGADGYLITLAPLFGSLASIERPLSCYRVHGGNRYWRSSVEERLHGSLARYERRSSTLRAFLQRQGLRCDSALWTGRNEYYQWMKRLERALAELRRVLPPDETFVLLDQDEWGGPPFADIKSIPFPECGGYYGGPPADDAAAIAELTRLRQQAAAIFVWAWPAFWWRAHYPSFVQHVECMYPTLADNDLFRVFDLRPSRVVPTPGGYPT